MGGSAGRRPYLAGRVRGGHNRHCRRSTVWPARGAGRHRLGSVGGVGRRLRARADGVERRGRSLPLGTDPAAVRGRPGHDGHGPGRDDLRPGAKSPLPCPRVPPDLTTGRPQARPHRSLTMTRANSSPAVAVLTATLLLSAAAPDASSQPAPVPVQVAAVQTADIPVTLQGIGSVQAFNTVTVRAQVGGVLQQIRFTEGQSVRAGEVLAQIDPRPFQAALDQATAKKVQDEAQLQNARLDLQRYAGLGTFASHQQLATQQAMVAQLEAQLRGDQAAIESAQTQLSYTTITSPMDGITGIRLIDQGNLLRATDATGIVVITQVQPISVVFTLPAETLAEIRQSMAAGPLHVTVLERQDQQPLG